MSFFGAQAVRLLRESWDGILRGKVNPETDDFALHPQGATLLAQELFSMLAGSEPMATTSPVSITPNPQPPDIPVPGLSITMPFGTSPAIATNAPITTTDSVSVCKTGFVSGVELKGGALGLKCTKDAFVADGKGATVNGDMNVNEGFYLWNGVPLDQAMAAGTTVFLGKVISGSANTYVVDLYGNGSRQPKTNPTPGQPLKLPGSDTNPPVSVNVLQIDNTETIPVGVWIGPIYEFTYTPLDPFGNPGDKVTVYEYLPPYWLI